MNPKPAGDVHYLDATTTLLMGDTTAVLEGLPAKSVDCVVTNPPRWDPRAVEDRVVSEGRRHDRDGTLQAYVHGLRKVFAQLYRVLADTGTVWLVLGDSRTAGLRRDLVGIPWRVAFGLQTDGWILRNAIVWNTSDATREAVHPRLRHQYEMVFLLTKQRWYFFDLNQIREPLASPRVSDISPTGRYHASSDTGTSRPAATRTATRAGRPRGKNPGDVWSITSSPGHDGSPTSLPVELPRRCIAAGCPAGGVVLDPFSGAAATGLAALQLGRSYIGIDLRPDMHDLGLRRLGLWSASAERNAAA